MSDSILKKFNIRGRSNDYTQSVIHSYENICRDMEKRNRSSTEKGGRRDKKRGWEREKDMVVWRKGFSSLHVWQPGAAASNLLAGLGKCHPGKGRGEGFRVHLAARALQVIILPRLSVRRLKHQSTMAPRHHHSVRLWYRQKKGVTDIENEGGDRKRKRDKHSIITEWRCSQSREETRDGKKVKATVYNVFSLCYVVR